MKTVALLRHTSRSLLCGALLVSLSLSPRTASAAETKTFDQILLESQTSLDMGTALPSDMVQKFANELIAADISVDQIDQYVRSKLTAKEYGVYQKQQKIMMKGLDPEKMTPNEFSQVVARALEVTQPKALTWSSCTTLTIGILVAVAAVIVGVIAIAKQKIDLITQNGLYSDWQNKKNANQAQYNDTANKLNNPQGYFNAKINSANSDISYDQSKINDLSNQIQSAQTDLRNAQYNYSHATTQQDLDYYSGRISSIQSSINGYSSDITRYNGYINDDQNNIQHYLGEKIRYLDPNVVAAEKAANEAWLPSAQLAADQNYQVNLTDMPANNAQITTENEQIAHSKETLGIIAGVGGATSLALILSSASSCQ